MNQNRGDVGEEKLPETTEGQKPWKESDLETPQTSREIDRL